MQKIKSRFVIQTKPNRRAAKAPMARAAKTSQSTLDGSRLGEHIEDVSYDVDERGLVFIRFLFDDLDVKWASRSLLLCYSKPLFWMHYVYFTEKLTTISLYVHQPFYTVQSNWLGKQSCVFGIEFDCEQIMWKVVSVVTQKYSITCLPRYGYAEG